MLTVVTGPPCSGKSTWIADRAKHGDVIIDLDRLALALTWDGTGNHDYPDYLRPIATEARRAALATALRLAPSPTVHVYVIHTAPSATQRQQYHRLGAQLVYLHTPEPRELARRIAARPRRNQAIVAAYYAGRQQEQAREPGPASAPHAPSRRSRQW